MIDEPTQPDTDPAEASVVEDAPDVEGHRRSRGRKKLTEDTDDGPDFEGHIRRGPEAAVQRKR